MSTIDVLIITALKEEYDAARDVALATRLAGIGVAEWEERDATTPTPYLLGRYVAAGGFTMNVALARSTRMGGTATSPVVASLVERLKPHCLAMCGVCAGNPGDVALGDVIMAEMVYPYDEGKQKEDGFEGDHRQTPMLDTWVRAAQDLLPDGLPSFGVASDEEAKSWLLERLYAGDNPRTHPALSRYFPGNSWRESVRAFEGEALIRREGLQLVLTASGRSFVEETLFYDVDGPQRLPFQIKVGPIASGNVVVKDGITWEKLKKWGVRSVLGLEMEAATIGSTAHRLGLPAWVVAKGVMDYADPRKDNRYKPFAARASSEVLFKFLSNQIPAIVSPRKEDFNVHVANLPTVHRLLIGRDKRLKQLDDAWTAPTIGLVSIVAFGGIGKTSLAINWWHSNGPHRNGPHRATCILGWSFYSQGPAEDRQAPADLFLDYALREWFDVANPPKDSWTRGKHLAELIRGERTLLILDGLEPLQFVRDLHGEDVGRFKDAHDGIVSLLKELAAYNPAGGLCVCTSRLPLTDLEDYGNRGVLPIDLEDLTRQSGAQYLKALRVKGTDDELEAASEDFGNNALALTLLGKYLRTRRGGDVRKRDTVPPILTEDVDKRTQGAHARRMFREYELLFRGTPELAVLRILGLFDRPADQKALRVLREHDPVLRDLLPDQWAGALETLHEARLLFEYSGPDGSLDCHPLVREHFSKEYRESNPDAFRKAHAKLYEHYSGQAPHQPDTLQKMAPLLYAVYHGCQAGKHRKALKEMYRIRIQRILPGKEGFYLIRNLGALGVDLSLLANFFASVWKTAVAGLSHADQAWVLGRAGYALHSVGRLDEALDSMQAGTDTLVKLKDWKEAARALGNLSRLQLDLGKIVDAIGTAQRSIKCADDSRDGFLRVFTRATLGCCFHQSGDRDEAGRYFADAERIQEELSSERPKLHAAYGYHYCELLLDRCRTDEVVRRATQTLAWHEKEEWGLQVALDHLSLGHTDTAGSADCGGHLDQAIQGLRRAGQLQYLPRGLLARAAHFRHTGEFDKAQKDLDEAGFVANRCRMQLHLTDYHLEQARLFLAQEQPEAAVHYDAAKKLVENTGYHRRDPELAELTGRV